MVTCHAIVGKSWALEVRGCDLRIAFPVDRDLVLYLLELRGVPCLLHLMRLLLLLLGGFTLIVLLANGWLYQCTVILHLQLVDNFVECGGIHRLAIFTDCLVLHGHW